MSEYEFKHLTGVYILDGTGYCCQDTFLYKSCKKGIDKRTVYSVDLIAIHHWLAMKKKRNKIGICSICGEEGELTREHLPPKGIFIKPRPKNTITAFSCKRCNHDTSLDDEYFRFWVTAGAHPDSKLGAVWKNKVVGSSFKRSPALLKKIQDDHKKLLVHHASIPLKTYQNEIVPDEQLHSLFMVDAERINRVARKIVRGLYFHHFSKPLPNNVGLTVSIDTNPFKHSRKYH